MSIVMFEVDFITKVSTGKILKNSSLQKLNSEIIYSPTTSCFKPVWMYFFRWTQRKI